MANGLILCLYKERQPELYNARKMRYENDVIVRILLSTVCRFQFFLQYLCCKCEYYKFLMYCVVCLSFILLSFKWSRKFRLSVFVYFLYAFFCIICTTLIITIYIVDVYLRIIPLLCKLYRKMHQTLLLSSFYRVISSFTFVIPSPIST